MWRRLVQAIKRLLSPHTPEMIVVVVWALLFRTILFNTQQLQLTLILQRTLEDMTTSSSWTRSDINLSIFMDFVVS